MPAPPATGALRLLPRIAPTTHDDESKSDPRANPDFDHLLARHRPRPHHAPHGRSRRPRRRLLHSARRLALRAGAARQARWPHHRPFPLKQSTLQAHDDARAARHYAGQLVLATTAEQSAIVNGEKGAAPLLAPRYPAIHGQDLRGFGWDIDTAFSKPARHESSPSAASATPASPAPPLDGPRHRHLRRPARQRDPPPRQSADLQPARRSRNRRRASIAALPPIARVQTAACSAIALDRRRICQPSPASTSSNPLTSLNSPTLAAQHNNTPPPRHPHQPVRPRRAWPPHHRHPRDRSPQNDPRRKAHHHLLARARHLRHAGHHRIRPRDRPHHRPRRHLALRPA